MCFYRHALAALTITSWAVLPGSSAAQRLAPPPAAALRSSGVGPLVLGAELKAAANRASLLDPLALPVGPGCDGRDEFAIRTELSGEPVVAMAMADKSGKIEEIIIEADSLERARTADSAACLELAKDFASKFSTALGPYPFIRSEQKPATVEYRLDFALGPSLRARWFRGGGHCDFALYIVHGDD